MSDDGNPLEDCKRLRRTYSGPEAHLYSILEQHAKHGGKSFIRYKECDKLGQTEVDVPMLKKYGALIRDLAGVQGNLSFARTMCLSCFKQLFDKFHEAWNMTSEWKSEWAEAMCQRLRNLCYHMAAALRKPAPAKWAKQIMDGGEQDDVAGLEVAVHHGRAPGVSSQGCDRSQ